MAVHHKLVSESKGKQTIANLSDLKKKTKTSIRRLSSGFGDNSVVSSPITYRTFFTHQGNESVSESFRPYV